MKAGFQTPAQALTLILAGLCAFLLLLLAIQRLFGGGDSAVEVIDLNDNNRPRAGALQTSGFELEPLNRYQAIVQRPLFNDTRRPIVEKKPGASEAELAAQKTPTELPPVTLTGVIITPDSRYAMIRNTRNNEFFALTVGTTLEGWNVDSINPRRVVFSNGGGQQVVELEVYTAGGGGGGRARAQPAAANANQSQTAAELIRQRIERERERRRQLIEAARKKQQGGG